MSLHYAITNTASEKKGSIDRLARDCFFLTTFRYHSLRKPKIKYFVVVSFASESAAQHQHGHFVLNCIRHRIGGTVSCLTKIFSLHQID